MANHPSAIKRHRQSLRRQERNQHVRTTVRTVIKKAKAAAAAGNKEQAGKLFKEAERTIARAVAKKVLHKNNGARRISRLAALLKKQK